VATITVIDAQGGGDAKALCACSSRPLPQVKSSRRAQTRLRPRPCSRRGRTTAQPAECVVYKIEERAHILLAPWASCWQTPCTRDHPRQSVDFGSRTRRRSCSGQAGSRVYCRAARQALLANLEYPVNKVACIRRAAWAAGANADGVYAAAKCKRFPPDELARQA
jgi:hypothetical protein